MIFFKFRPIVDWSPQNVENTSQSILTNGHTDRATSINNFCATLQTIRGIHCDRAHNSIAKFKRNFDDQISTIFEFNF